MLRIVFWNVVDYLKVYERVVFVEEEFAPFTKRKCSHQWRVALLSPFDWSRLPPDIRALGPDTSDTSGGSWRLVHPRPPSGSGWKRPSGSKKVLFNFQTDPKKAWKIFKLILQSICTRPLWRLLRIF